MSELDGKIARAVEQVFEETRADPWEPDSILAVLETIASPLKALLGTPGPLFKFVGETGVELFIALRALVSAMDATRTLGPDRQRVAQNIVFNLLNGTSRWDYLLALASEEFIADHYGEGDHGLDELQSAGIAFEEALKTLISAQVVYREGEECFLA